VGDQRRLPELFGLDAPDETEDAGSEVELRQNLWSISIDPDRALLEWLQALGGRVSGRVLASSGTFQYFAAAAPGAKELVSMVKIWKLTEGEGGSRKRPGGYDLVILDAPARSHASGRSPPRPGRSASFFPTPRDPPTWRLPSRPRWRSPRHWRSKTACSTSSAAICTRS
jgi:hypothetical protein